MSKGNRNGAVDVNVADILNDDDGDNDGDKKGGGVVVVNVVDMKGTITAAKKRRCGCRQCNHGQ